MSTKPATATRVAAALAHDDRRSELRLTPEQVPWIREVKPATGDAARLVDISRSGLQLETTARLAPGRRSAVLVVDAEDRVARAEGLVVRTQLVAISPSGERVYRSALRFTEPIDPRIPATHVPIVEPEPVPAVSPLASMVSGPFEAMLEIGASAQFTTVSRLSETACVCDAVADARAGLNASVTICFAGARSLVLSGTVASVDGSHTVVRFANVDAETKRALRVELREARSPAQLVGAVARTVSPNQW